MPRHYAHAAAQTHSPAAIPAAHIDPRPLVERTLPACLSADGREWETVRVMVNLSESPLSWLHARGHITTRQCDAGDALRRDYEAAEMGARVTMRWSPLPPSRGRRGGDAPLHDSDRVIAAKRRFDDAINALGRDLGHIAWRVVCAGEGVPLAEKALGWPARSGKLVLRIALDRLASHYRLPG